MSDPRKDDQLDDDLKAGLKALSGAYRAAPGLQEPPAALDDAIRAAARRAVSAGPRPVARTWLSRSSTPLAAAAVLVLTVSIGFLSLDDPNVPVQSRMEELAMQRGAPSAAQSPAPAAVPPAMPPKQEIAQDRAGASGTVAAPEPEPEKRAAAPAKPAAPKADARLRYSNEAPAAAPGAGRKSSAPEQYVPAPPAPVVVPAPAAAPAPVPPPPPAPTAQPPSRADVESVTVLTEPARPQEPKREGPVAAARAPAAASAPAAPAVPAPASVPQSIGEVQVAKQKESLAAKQFAPAPKPLAPAQERVEVAGARVQAPADQARAKRDAAAGTAARGEMDLANRAAEKPAEKAAGLAGADDAFLGPEAWVKRIVELQRRGKTKEAAEELKKFRKRYPDYALPADLRELK